jgi:hypothetical protein
MVGTPSGGTQSPRPAVSVSVAGCAGTRKAAVRKNRSIRESSGLFMLHRLTLAALVT